MKHEGSKHTRRDLYLVLDTDNTTMTLVIAKLPHALSGNQPITFQPHNVKYIVKQTDVILSPNQPTEYFQNNYEVLDVFEDVTFDLDSPEPKQIKKKKPQYPYEDDDDDDLEFV